MNITGIDGKKMLAFLQANGYNEENHKKVTSIELVTYEGRNWEETIFVEYTNLWNDKKYYVLFSKTTSTAGPEVTKNWLEFLQQLEGMETPPKSPTTHKPYTKKSIRKSRK